MAHRLLILTDHRGHSQENALYALARAMQARQQAGTVSVATRGDADNDPFFSGQSPEQLYATEVDRNFWFRNVETAFAERRRAIQVRDYDLIWLRLPPPLGLPFVEFLERSFPNTVIINDPRGIYKTGSKAFLTRFPELCPPMAICRSVEDIVALKTQFPIVLKPLREYGGRGIVRVQGDQVWAGQNQISFDAFAEQLAGQPVEYLGVKYLKNVDQGDKRIVVVDGRIMGASLRLPRSGSWICNVAMGGTSHPGNVEEAERNIVATIDPVLREMGIVMYGVDTLVGDDGQRVLSEINTTSIGGLPQIAAASGLPLVEDAADLLWSYLIKEKNHKLNTL